MNLTDDERRAIRDACIDLQMRYAWTADHRQPAEFTALFAEDGSVEVPGAPAFVGHAAIRASIDLLHSLPITARHVITNPIVDVIDADRATGSCYLVVFNSDAEPDESGAWPMKLPSTIGEYHDTYHRTPDGWRIETRVLRRVFRSPDDPMRKYT